MAHLLGGKVTRGQREYGKGTLLVTDPLCSLFANLPDSLQVWNSHGDKLTDPPTGFKAVATLDNSEFAAIEHRERKLFGLQFHPEVAHTPKGREIISNFSWRLRLRQGLDDVSITSTRPWRKSARWWAANECSWA